MSHPGNDAVIEQIRDHVAEMSLDDKMALAESYVKLTPRASVSTEVLFSMKRFIDSNGESNEDRITLLDDWVKDILIEALPDGGDE